MEKAIGGYFELELPRHEEYHKNALRLNSGKNCLEYILRCRNYSKVYIPYYTCDVVLKPFQKLGVEFVFYHIDKYFEIEDNIFLEEEEALLYTNYFGLKSDYINVIFQKYGSKLIIDNTQAFFAPPLPGIDTFYTCRKFFGVSDGAYLYTNKKTNLHLDYSTSYKHTSHLIKRIDVSPEDAFEEFHLSEENLANEEIKKMSKFTHRMMCSIDYESVAEKRKRNFETIHNALGSINELDLQLNGDFVPMVYPYLVSGKDIRNKLIQNKIFIARYWPNVLEWTTKDDLEYILANRALYLPIDQRYDKDEMYKIINYIKT